MPLQKNQVSLHILPQPEFMLLNFRETTDKKAGTSFFSNTPNTTAGSAVARLEPEFPHPGHGWVGWAGRWGVIA
jgi:hypothetical protein